MIITTFKTPQLATQSLDFLNAVRVLGKPYKAGSIILECSELQPRIDAVTIQDAPAVFTDGVFITPAQCHTEFQIQADYVPQTELTPAQIAEGWMLLLSRETLAQYKLDNAEAIAAELAAMNPPATA